MSRTRTLYTIIMLLILMSLPLSMGWASDGYTPLITDAQGRIMPNSIAALVKETIGGVDQWLLIRGQNSNNPILLFLHGGPGTSEIGFVRHFNADWERDFVVVNWDQRGCAKSYAETIPVESMTVEQFIADAHEVVELLKTRFQCEKIYVVGHSWGSLLGMHLIQRYPQSFYAYIGIGQIVNAPVSEKVVYQHILQQARQANHQEAIAELEQLGEPDPTTGLYKDVEHGVDVARKWVLAFGGSLHGKTGYDDIMPIYQSATEYSDADRENLMKDTHVPAMEEVIHRTNLYNSIPEVRVPVYFFLGRHDYQTPAEVAAAYLNVLKAPKKELVWFEESAHSPCFEEPEKFYQLLVSKVLTETYHQ